MRGRTAIKWLIENGVAIPRETQITSKQHFGDMQLHLEWSAPTEIRGEGQGRGNSGCYLMGLYEVQILDSFENKTYFDGQAGSIYKQTPPLANAMRKPGEWNYYDIIFNAPKFRSNGDVVKPGYVTLIQNGVLMLNHFELEGPTIYTEAPHYKPHPEVGPDLSAVPRRRGQVPQHLGSRDQAARGQTRECSVQHSTEEKGRAEEGRSKEGRSGQS